MTKNYNESIFTFGSFENLPPLRAAFIVRTMTICSARCRIRGACLWPVACGCCGCRGRGWCRHSSTSSISDRCGGSRRCRRIGRNGNA